MVEQTALQWTKEPPTEKDVGKTWCIRRIDNGYIVAGTVGFETWDSKKALVIKSCGTEYFHSINIIEKTSNYEFLGPLPE